MTPTSGFAKFHSDLQVEHICSLWATLSTPEVIGPLAEGVRIHVYVTAGEVTGPRLRGRLRTVGGDWLSLRPDGIGMLDVRITVESHDGALIYMTYGGVADLGEDGYERFLAGKPPARVPLRTAPRCSTGNASYLWLNRLQCVGVGEVDMETLRVSYDIYALR